MPDTTAEAEKKQRRNAWVIAALIVAIGVLAVAVTVGGTRPTEGPEVPDVTGKGLQWAQNEVAAAGWNRPANHDAMGRGRGTGDEREWKVCFQTLPSVGPGQRNVELGRVLVTEDCPAQDMGAIEPANGRMPDLVGRTALMARTSMGDDASLRFEKRGGDSGDGTIEKFFTNDNDTTDSDLGEWLICAQNRAAGDPWTGQPVRFEVVPYEEGCTDRSGIDD